MRIVLALCLFLMASVWAGPAAAACQTSSEPKSDGRSQWYCASASSTVFVFVHGLNSNSADAWQHGGDSKDAVFWPELVKNDPLLRASDSDAEPPSILLASFHTGAGSRSFSIADAQRQIFDALFSSIDGQPPAIEKRTIILVGHSLGGVLLRDVLARNSERFLGKRLGLLLVASPSKGSSFANVASYAQWAIDNTMVRELEQGSAYLDDVNKRFAAAIGEGGTLNFLVGRELHEQLGLLESKLRCASNTLSISSIACAAGQHLTSAVSGGPVVPKDSAVVYWPETARLVPQSDHSSIARPSDVGHPTHQALRELVAATQATAVSACLPPQNFGFTFKIQSQSAKCEAPSNASEAANFDLVQLDTNDGVPLRPMQPLTFDPITRAYRLRVSEPPFPCTNEVFWGKLVPTVQTSRRVTSDLCATDVCFRRSRRATAARFAVFNCVAGDKCLVPDATAGVADVCESADRTAIMAAAEPNPQAGDVQWTSPSLQTLEDVEPAKRSGYAEFLVISDPITNVTEATSFGYGVSVNGQPVRFDGQPPFAERRPITPGGRIHLTFPIEDLGFRGGNAGDGYEEITVQIKFFKGDAAIGTATLQRRYVTYRHAATIRETDAETGETFSWRAIYRPSTSGHNFEVMLEHGADAKWMTGRRANLDQLAKTYSGQPVIGVLRPGRRENKRIGMIVGLVQETGQVRSLFARDEAAKLCKWVLAQPEFGELQKKFSYVFEFPDETFDETQDRGRRVAYCSEL